MMTTRCGRWLTLGILAVLSTLSAAMAEDPAPGKSTNTAAPVTISAPKISEPAVSKTISPTAATDPALVDSTPNPLLSDVATATTAAAAVTLEPIATVGEPTPPLATSIGLDSAGAAKRQPDEETQRRLEAPTPEQLIERHGSIGFLFRQPEPRNFLELINPFAPTDFGPRERETFNRDPNLRPGATLPRTFINDLTHEPVMSLFDWAW
ncbi:MAG: hypothetical protein RIS76_1465 [Verrucomicrobiota bacterium]|jgi:hypothetical protein